MYHSIIIQCKIIVYICYTALYKNDTFSFILQEVSLKYHNIARSLIKFGFESIKKKCLLFLFYSLSCPSSGHSWTKRWASTEQATGTHGPSVGHRQNKRRALIAHAVCTECPNVGQFLGTSYRSAALPLCMMPHDYLVVIE